ncbi:MAG: hypothetical protein IPG11_18035 [Flavobacteriales bacterium]|nr:hypothetical protein [Flavobacteriales bacterium]
MQERKSALGEMALLRTQQLVQLRLNGLFSEMAEDIREEAAAIEISDSTVVFDRWYPLLRTHWPILSIKLANEVGDELALIRGQHLLGDPHRSRIGGWATDPDEVHRWTKA